MSPAVLRVHEEEVNFVVLHFFHYVLIPILLHCACRVALIFLTSASHRVVSSAIGFNQIHRQDVVYETRDGRVHSFNGTD